EHPRRPLRPPVTGVAAVYRKGDPALLADRLGGLAHQEADLPVTGVIPQSDRLSVLAAETSLRAHDHELRSESGGRVPAHTDVLREPEEVATRLLQQHPLGQREASSRPLSVQAG